MSYKVRINTDAYSCMRCSKKNWEPGTVNDFMLAINGWHTTERTLTQVMWRLNLFHGLDHIPTEYDGNEREDSYGMSERYCKWLHKKCNTIRYMDRLCGFERTHYPSGYGWMQGYFSIGAKMQELENTGYTRVYFSELYDIRQFNKNMRGCYMEIERTGTDNLETIKKEYAKKVWGRRSNCI